MARRGRGHKSDGRGSDIPNYPPRGRTRPEHRPPARPDVGVGCQGPVPIGAGICRPKVEQGTVGSGWPVSGAHCPDGSGRAEKCMAFLLESTELPPPCALGGHRSRARPACKGLAAWPGGTHPPALARARLPRGRRQDPEPGSRARWCGPARSGQTRSAAGWRWEPGEGARHRRGRGCLTQPAASPTPGLPVPPRASTSSKEGMGGGVGIWTPRRSGFQKKETVNGGSF